MLGPSLHLNLHPCFFLGWIFILIPQAPSVAQFPVGRAPVCWCCRGVSSQIRSDHSRQEEELGFSAHGMSTRLPQPRVCLSSFPPFQRPPALQSSILNPTPPIPTPSTAPRPPRPLPPTASSCHRCLQTRPASEKQLSSKADYDTTWVLEPAAAADSRALPSSPIPFQPSFR